MFRIAVFPSQGEMLYYYQKGEKLFSAVFESGRTRAVRGEEMVREMRDKF